MPFKSSLVRVKICGITNVKDALAAANFGADAIGLRIRPKLNKENTKLIVKSLPPLITPVLLIRSSDPKNPKEIARLCNLLEISTIQLYTELNIEEIQELKNNINGGKIIKAIPIRGKESVTEALKIQCYVDALLLDTYDEIAKRLGGTGIIHDWKISREIVKSVQIPVILAGGITTDNVEKAIDYVRPWGIDCETGVEKSDGIKDLEKMRDFIFRCKRFSLENQTYEEA